MFMLTDGVGEVVQWTSPIGAAGIVAWMFKYLMDRYQRLAEDFRGIVERNTAAITELTVVVRRLNGR